MSIQVQELNKSFRVHVRQEGWSEALRSLFKREYQTVQAAWHSITPSTSGVWPEWDIPCWEWRARLAHGRVRQTGRIPLRLAQNQTTKFALGR